MISPSIHRVDVHVGNRVRTRRRLRGMSQGDLARACDITFQQIQKYERGANRVSASRLYQLAGVLGVTPGWFFVGLDQVDGDAEASEGEELRRAICQDFDVVKLLDSLVAMSPIKRKLVLNFATQAVGMIDEIAATQRFTVGGGASENERRDIARLAAASA